MTYYISLDTRSDTRSNDNVNHFLRMNRHLLLYLFLELFSYFGSMFLNQYTGTDEKYITALFNKKFLERIYTVYTFFHLFYKV